MSVGSNRVLHYHYRKGRGRLRICFGGWNMGLVGADMEIGRRQVVASDGVPITTGDLCSSKNDAADRPPGAKITPDTKKIAAKPFLNAAEAWMMDSLDGEYVHATFH